MANMTNGSYDAVDVLRATISWTLYNKLSNADAPKMIWWGNYAKTLEPEWDWEYTSSLEEEFKSRLYVPDRELVRAGLHYPARFGSRNPDRPDFLMLGDQPSALMKIMKKSELEAWSEDRLYGACPWLKP